MHTENILMSRAPRERFVARLENLEQRALLATLIAIVDSGFNSSSGYYGKVNQALSYDAFNNQVGADKVGLINGQPHGDIVASNAAVGLDATIAAAGYDPQAQLLLIRDANPNTANAALDLTAIVDGIIYAADQGARVINLSFAAGGDFIVNSRRLGRSMSLSGAIDYAAQRNSVIVTAVTNNNENVDVAGTQAAYPAEFRAVNQLVAMASDPNNRLAKKSDSSYGPTTVDVAAPGDATSYAAGYVSGVTGAIAALRPDFSATQLVGRIRTTVQQSSSLAGLNNTGGAIDPTNAARGIVSNVAINAGGGFVGNFTSDRSGVGASQYSSSAAVSTAGQVQPAPAALYQSMAFGNSFSYTVSDLAPNQFHTVRLHFAETFQTQAGKRIFNVSVNGNLTYANLDVFAAAGGINKALVLQTPARSNASGRITISFAAVSGSSDTNAMVSGIEVRRRAANDFDGDGRSDIALFTPPPASQTNNWLIDPSSGPAAGGASDPTHGSYNQGTRPYAATFGNSGAFAGRNGVPVPADYNGDGVTDLAMYYPAPNSTTAATWDILLSAGPALPQPLGYQVNFGGQGFVPVPADYNGDGKAEIAAYYPASATWFIAPNAGPFATDANHQGTGGYTVQFGPANSVAVPGDYNGDGKADVAFFSGGSWGVAPNSGPNATDPNHQGPGGYLVSFGNSSSIPVPADYNGDGRTDVAVFNAGTWAIAPNAGPDATDANHQGPGGYLVSFGGQGSIPVPADYTGEGHADVAVFFPPSTGNFFNWAIAPNAGPNASDASHAGRAAFPVAFGSGGIPLSQPTYYFQQGIATSGGAAAPQAVRGGSAGDATPSSDSASGARVASGSTSTTTSQPSSSAASALATSGRSRTPVNLAIVARQKRHATLDAALTSLDEDRFGI